MIAGGQCDGGPFFLQCGDGSRRIPVCIGINPLADQHTDRIAAGVPGEIQKLTVICARGPAVDADGVHPHLPHFRKVPEIKFPPSRGEEIRMGCLAAVEPDGHWIVADPAHLKGCSGDVDGPSDDGRRCPAAYRFYEETK
jgi:hypothetical protein